MYRALIQLVNGTSPPDVKWWTSPITMHCLVVHASLGEVVVVPEETRDGTKWQARAEIHLHHHHNYFSPSPPAADCRPPFY